MGARTCMETIEDIVLRYSKRGMDVLRKHMEEDFCRQAAERLMKLPKGTILLTTGFYVEGHAETDGPVGTVALGKALKKLGYFPVIVTDKYCRGFFEIADLEVCYVDVEAEEPVYAGLLENYQPVALISIERCGRNIRNDYENMRGISIKDYTAKTDILFEQARHQGIPTFAVGDGGNEIGMGNYKQVIREELSLIPCDVETDSLVIATVSNWGAYAMAAYLQKLAKVKVLPDYEEVENYLRKIVGLGSVDGVTKTQELSVDGFSLEVEKEILENLHLAVENCG